MNSSGFHKKQRKCVSIPPSCLLNLSFVFLSPVRAGDSSYAFLALLLHMQGINEGNLQHSDFADLAEKQCQLLEKGALRRAVEIRQKAVFSRSGISPEQADILFETAQTLAERLYANAGKLRRFYLRWIRHIVL